MVIPRIELLVTLRIELQGLLLGDVAIAVLPLGTGTTAGVPRLSETTLSPRTSLIRNSPLP